MWYKILKVFLIEKKKILISTEIILLSEAKYKAKYGRCLKILTSNQML